MKKYKVLCYCEPQLGKRGLYPSISKKKKGHPVRTMMDFLAYADGTNDLIDISNIIRKPAWELFTIINKLLQNGLIEIVP